MNKDLTVGNPQTVLLRFSLPLLGSVVFQQLYNIADSLVAGRWIGENALAAVGNAYEITLIFIAFAMGSSVGCSIIISRLFGAKKYADLRTAVSTVFIAVGVLCASLMALGLLLCTQLLALINTPELLMADCRLYLDIYFLGLPFLFYYNVATGIFSAMGDSRTPFLFLACSSTVNILVNILFVAGFHMGVAGVAWATFLCQGVSCALSLMVVLRRLRGIRTEGRVPLFSLAMLRRFTAIALPSTLQQSFISVGNIVIQSAINGFGAGAMAGYSAAVKLNNLVITSFTTISNGISNYSAQNLGAGKLGRVRAGFRAGLKLVWLISVPLVAIYCLLGRQALMLFMNDPTDAALEAGLMFLRIVSPFYFVVSAKLVADGILRGTGLMKRFMATTLVDLMLRVVLALVLSRTSLGATGIWCAWPVGWSISTAMSLAFYHTGPWRGRAEEPDQAES